MSDNLNNELLKQILSGMNSSKIDELSWRSRVESNMATMNTKLDNIQESLKDKETRISSIEKTHNIIKGAVSIILFIGFGSIITWIRQKFHL